MSTPTDQKHFDAQGQDRSSDQRSAAATSGEGSAHTPGPWFVLAARHTDERDVSTVGSRSQIGNFIATAWGGGEMNARIDANAHLIAAAPDLYAACRALLAYHLWASTGEWRDVPADPQALAQAALAKAEGRR